MDTELMLRGLSLTDEFARMPGDPRRRVRAMAVAGGMAKDPTTSFPKLFPTEAEREGFYRFVNNDSVTLAVVTEAHREMTAERSRQLGEVLAVHDSTEFAWATHDGYLRENLCPFSKQRQGFKAHVTLAVSADGMRAPLGVLGFIGYVDVKKMDSEAAAFWSDQFGELERQSNRWVLAFAEAERRVAGRASLIHVCDREADTNDDLEWLRANDARYVLRGFQGRMTVDGVLVHEVARAGTISVTREIALSPRSEANRPPNSRKNHPARRARIAKIVVRAKSAIFPVGPEQMPLNVVEVSEIDAPDGEEPVQWTLLTSEPIDDEASILRVVDIYRSRWMVEEYFKAIKTGCAFSDRQLDSASSLLVALGITLVVAWQLLVLRHLSRHEHGHLLPATDIMSPRTLALLIASTRKSMKWPEDPTIFDAMRGVARLGGHITSNGLPGWQVLGRGFEKLLAIENAVDVALAAGLVINP